MGNTSRVYQLKRDADKAGNYQAKLGYAEYLIRHKESYEDAKPYLIEILNNRENTYIPDANKLLKEIEPGSRFVDDIAAEAHLQFSCPNSHLLNNNELSSVTADEEYKKLRYAYVHQLNHMNVGTYYAELGRIASRSDVSDSLWIKILMQEIYALLTCYQNEWALLQAKQLCEQLMDNPNYKDTKKVEWAGMIHQNITDALNKPVSTTKFRDHMKSHVDAGFEVGRQFGKYLFLVIGQVIDIGLLGIPKMGAKCLKDGGNIWTGYKHGILYNLFYNAGAAVIGKVVGKFIGKYVLGTLIGLPITLLTGIISYPFRMLHEYLTNSKKIVGDTVSAILSMEVTKEKSIEGGEAKSQSIKIFERKGEQHKVSDLNQLTENATQDWRSYSTESSAALNLYGLYREVYTDEPASEVKSNSYQPA